MKKAILMLGIITSILFGDDPCIGEGKTTLKFEKKYPYNVVVKKYRYEDGCGIQKETLDIFQDNKKIDTISEIYGVDLLNDSDMNNDGKIELVMSGHSGGFGTDTHKIAVVESNMKLSFEFKGDQIRLVDIDKDNDLELLTYKSVFFCISSEFCSHGTSLVITIASKFKDYHLVLDKEATLILKQDVGLPCQIDVMENSGAITFSDKACAENNLLLLAYDILVDDIDNLKKDLKYFTFDSKQTEEKFRQEILKNIDYEVTQDVKNVLMQ